MYGRVLGVEAEGIVSVVVCVGTWGKDRRRLDVLQSVFLYRIHAYDIR